MRIALLAAVMICSGCSDACQKTVVSRSPSPDGTHVAVLFQRDCGATTGFSTQISILAANDKPSGGGNAFVADDGHGAARVGDWEGSWADMKWLSRERLRIRYATKSRIFKQEERVSGVTISYQMVGS